MNNSILENDRKTLAITKLIYQCLVAYRIKEAYKNDDVCFFWYSFVGKTKHALSSSAKSGSPLRPFKALGPHERPKQTLCQH